MTKRKKQCATFHVSASEYHDRTTGRCLSCRAEAFGVEPDADGYECEACGEHNVYGLEELLLMGLVVVGDGKAEGAA